MSTNALKAELESSLGGPVFAVPKKRARQTILTGIPQLDAEYGGVPRGAITEIVGPSCSGRTTLLHSILAESTVQGEACALVDASDAFDPSSAAAAGVALQQLFWIRCAAHKNNVLRVADLVLQSGGWGAIVLDLGDIEPRDARRIPLNAWYRFRRAIENQSTAFIVLGQASYAGSCSALVLETSQAGARWKGMLFGGADFRAGRRKPPGRITVCFKAQSELMGIEVK